MDCHVYVDSSAAIGVAQRKGSGKIRHVRVGLLWIQEKVEEDELQIHKVHGESNPADLLMKHLTRGKIDHYMALFGQAFLGGRAKSSLRL